MTEHIQLSEDQGKFLSAVKKGQNIFLTGKAGTGKTHVVKTAMAMLTEQGKQFIAVAPTGVAANNMGGVTAHSMFALTPHGMISFDDCNWMRAEKRRIFDMVDVIFIDEVSMLRPDMLDGMNWTLIKNGCKPLTKIQIIFIGDLKQLPAPIDDNFKSILLTRYDDCEFFNALIYKQLDVRTIELNEVKRQSDPEFIDNLNLIRDGFKAPYFRQFMTKVAKGIILAPHNTTVFGYNQQGLASVDGPTYTYHAIVDGNLKPADFNMETVINVKDGLKIMYLVNSKNNNLINGTLGIFRMMDDTPMIEVDGIL